MSERIEYQKIAAHYPDAIEEVYEFRGDIWLYHSQRATAGGLSPAARRHLTLATSTSATSPPSTGCPTGKKARSPSGSRWSTTSTRPCIFSASS
jgi:hypothetical protein